MGLGHFCRPAYEAAPQRFQWIPNDWEDREVRLVVGLHELELRSDPTSLPALYPVGRRLPSEDLSAILELNIPGLTVESSTVGSMPPPTPPIFWEISPH